MADLSSIAIIPNVEEEEDVINLFGGPQLEPAVVENSTTAFEYNPDQYAKDTTLGQHFEMPAEHIDDGNRADLENQRAVESLQDAAFDAPVLGEFIGARPELSRLSHDDLPSLLSSEKAGREMGFFGAFGKGVDILQGLGYRFLEAGSEAVGAESLEDYAQRQAEINFIQSDIAGEKMDFTKIANASDFFIWAKQTAGEQMPLMAPALAGAGIGAGIGSAIPVVGTALGAVIGAFIPSFILGVGETQQNIKQRDASVEAPGTAFGAGALVGLLDSALPGRVGTLMRKAFGRELTEKALGDIATRVMVRNAAAETVGGMTVEGLTEVVQEVISETAAASATNTPVGDLSNQLINAFAAGAFLGGVTGGTASASSNLIKARRQKQTMDILHSEEVKSKLRGRDAALNAEVKAEQLKAGGVDNVFAPVEGILQWAQGHEKGVDVALTELGVIDSLQEAVASGGQVQISATSFVRHVLGTDGYETLSSQVSFDEASPSLDQAAAAIFENEEIEANLATELEAYDAAEDLKARVQETLGKVKSGAAKAIEEAPSDVRAVLDDLIARAAQSGADVSEAVRTGRVAQLDQEISLIDSKIGRLQDELQTAEEAGLGTKQREARIAKAVAQRDKLISEQTSLGFEEIQVGVSDEVQAEFEAGETQARKNKPVKTKAKTLLDLGVKVSREAVRATRKAFSEALKTERSFAKKKEAIIKELRQLDGFKDLSTTKQKSLEATIRRVKSEDKLAAAVDAVRSKAAEAIEQVRVKQLTAAINTLLKKNKSKRNQKRKNGTIGRMTPEISDFIDNIPTLLKLSKKDAQALLKTATDDPHRSGGTMSPGLQAVRNMVLDVTARPDQVNVTDLENLLLSLKEIVVEGKAINRQNAFNKAAKQAEMRQIAEDIVNPIVNEEVQLDEDGNVILDDNGEPKVVIERMNKTGGKVVEVLGRIEAAILGQNGAWWNKLYRIARSRNKKEVDAWVKSLSLFEEARAMHKGTKDMTAVFTEKATTRLGMTQRQVLQYMQDASAEKVVVGEFQFANDTQDTIEMSRAELIHLVGQLQNESVRERSRHKGGDAYTDEIIEALENKLTETDKRMVISMTEFYNEYYPRINAAYSKAEGINLIKEEDYFPTSREGDAEDLSFLGQMLFGGNVTSGALSPRTGSTKPLVRRNGFAVLINHINEMEYYIAYREKVSDINAVFNGNMLHEVERIFGKTIKQSIESDRDYFAQKGARSAFAGEKFYIQLMRNFSVAQLGLSGVITAKQFMSAPAFAENVSTKDFMAGVAHLIAHPKKAWAVMNESEHFNTRGQHIDGDFLDVTADQFGNRVMNILGRNPNFTKFLTFNIRFGDKGAILIGGYAHYFAMKKQLKKGGATEAEAHTEALASMDRVTVKTQQSPDPDQKSELQRSNAFGRILSQFMSSASALTRAEYAAVVERVRGRTTNAQLAKSIVIYHLVIPNMIQMAANLFQWDDEDQIRASILGSFNGLFVIGDMLDAIVNASLGAETIFPPETRHPLKVFSDLMTAIINLEDITWEEMLDGTRDIDRAIKSTSGITGVPVAKMYNMIRGVTETVDGNVPEGLALFLGWSPYAIDKNEIGF